MKYLEGEIKDVESQDVWEIFTDDEYDELLLLFEEVCYEVTYRGDKDA